MKVIQEYEESDIDINNDKLHSLLSVSILISSLIMAPAGSKPSENKEEFDKNLKTGVANFLNMLGKSGYSITKNEDIPKAFNF